MVGQKYFKGGKRTFGEAKYTNYNKIKTVQKTSGRKDRCYGAGEKREFELFLTRSHFSELKLPRV